MSATSKHGEPQWIRKSSSRVGQSDPHGLGAVCAPDFVIKHSGFTTISKVTDPDLEHFDENTLLESHSRGFVPVGENHFGQPVRVTERTHRKIRGSKLQPARIRLPRMIYPDLAPNFRSRTERLCIHQPLFTNKRFCMHRSLFMNGNAKVPFTDGRWGIQNRSVHELNVEHCGSKVTLAGW